jgi:hypothetical protein
MKQRLAILAVLMSLLIGALVPVFAQDAMMEEGAVCDSTLATLILVAEYNYDYLSGMMMDETMMEMMPKLNFGQYQPLIDSIVAMMMEMEGDMMMEMTPEEQAAHDEMLASFMGMDSQTAISTYMTSMMMEMTEENMTVLTAGNVANEDPACATARASVESFLLAHILTEMSMHDMMP